MSRLHGDKKPGLSRRHFLQSTAAATVGATTLGFPMIAKAQQTITLKFQSTWPTKDIFHEYALDMDANMLLAWVEYGGGKRESHRRM
ncbi:MAG TPA: twin-arginine translocation signal domain-containing protein [Candidatus Competibacteraceae bacterium]|nr:twin-arginine translocation signal domain-containing protein [Candidatus Competibacteraceae bacterium]